MQTSFTAFMQVCREGGGEGKLSPGPATFGGPPLLENIMYRVGQKSKLLHFVHILAEY